MSKLSENKKEIQQCISACREVTYRRICGNLELMYEGIGSILRNIEQETGEPVEIDKPVCGIPTRRIRQIKEKYNEEVETPWLEEMDETEKAAALMEFLRTDSLRMKSLRERYPNAFRRWTEEEDAALLEAYNSFPGPVRWSELSKKFGRNTNAVKIRLERLGIELGIDAGRIRYPR